MVMAATRHLNGGLADTYGWAKQDNLTREQNRIEEQ